MSECRPMAPHCHFVPVVSARPFWQLVTSILRMQCAWKGRWVLQAARCEASEAIPVGLPEVFGVVGQPPEIDPATSPPPLQAHRRQTGSWEIPGLSICRPGAIGHSDSSARWPASVILMLEIPSVRSPALTV
jgi:hypothetical protein